jgi:hypothetical protein
MPYQFKREPLLPEEATRLAQACQTVREKLVIWTLLDKPRQHFLYARAECSRLYHVGLLRHPVVSSTPVGNDAKLLADVRVTARQAGIDIPRCCSILVPLCMHAIVSMALMAAV